MPTIYSSTNTIHTKRDIDFHFWIFVFCKSPRCLELNAIESDISKIGSSNVLIWNIDYIDCFNVK